MRGVGLNWSAGNHAVLVSHANYWSDALGAASLGGGANPVLGTEPLLLTESPSNVGVYTTGELAILKSEKVTNLMVLGGPLAMRASTVQNVLSGL